jgi:hypothetical protein
LGVGHGQELEQQRQLVVEGRVQQQELSGDPLARGLLRVRLRDPEVIPQQL